MIMASVIEDFFNTSTISAASSVLDRVDGQGSLFDKSRDLLDDVNNHLKTGRNLYGMRSERMDSGKERLISNPCNALVPLLTKLESLVERVPIHSSCHGSGGFTPEKSVRHHVPLRTAFTFDVANAGPSISSEMVAEVYYRALDGFDLSESDRQRVASNFANLSVTYYRDLKKTGLPLGTRLTDRIFQRVFYEIDSRLDEVAEEKGMKYSRWGDDMKITSHHSVGLKDFAGAIDIVEKNGLKVSPGKIFLQQLSDRGVFMLGHVVYPDGSVYHNDVQLKNEMKAPSVNYEIVELIRKNENYEKWI